LKFVNGCKIKRDEFFIYLHLAIVQKKLYFNIIKKVFKIEDHISNPDTLLAENSLLGFLATSSYFFLLFRQQQQQVSDTSISFIQSGQPRLARLPVYTLVIKENKYG